MVELTSEETELLTETMEILVGYLGSIRKLDEARRCQDACPLG
jgi:hypothetical protein